jgi:hypothetical protein
MANDFIDWESLLKSSQNPSYGGIRDVLTSSKESYRDVAGKEIMPLLQPGTDPYLQQAINEIVRQGKESKARSLADVTTSAQSRGLTGSSIESGDLTQTATQAELGQQGQITNIIAQDAATKKQNMIQFLTSAYGMDFQAANQMADNLAQLMGQELGRQNDLAIAKMSKVKQPSFLETIAPALIGAGAKIAIG